MVLVIDIGNTNTTLGLLREDEVVDQWRVSSGPRTTDELGLLLLQLLAHRGHSPAQIEGAIVACVVPSVLFTWSKACRRYLNHEPLVVGRGLRTGVRLRVDNPREVGADRIVNTAAALARWPAPLVIVDFGTATTFDCVNREGDYVGGAIAPGLQISADALVTRTSKLPRVEVARPRRAIGANTVESMQSGLFLGYVGLVDHLARQCKAELSPPGGPEVRCVATGGFSNLVGRACAEVDEVDPDLTLRGLSVLWRLNRGGR